MSENLGGGLLSEIKEKNDFRRFTQNPLEIPKTRPEAIELLITHTSIEGFTAVFKYLENRISENTSDQEEEKKIMSDMIKCVFENIITTKIYNQNFAAEDENELRDLLDLFRQKQRSLIKERPWFLELQRLFDWFKSEKELESLDLMEQIKRKRGIDDLDNATIFALGKWEDSANFGTVGGSSAFFRSLADKPYGKMEVREAIIGLIDANSKKSVTHGERINNGELTEKKYDDTKERAEAQERQVNICTKLITKYFDKEGSLRAIIRGKGIWPENRYLATFFHYEEIINIDFLEALDTNMSLKKILPKYCRNLISIIRDVADICEAERTLIAIEKEQGSFKGDKKRLNEEVNAATSKILVGRDKLIRDINALEGTTPFDPKTMKFGIFKEKNEDITTEEPSTIKGLIPRKLRGQFNKIYRT